MTFTYDNADLSRTIKDFYRDGMAYYVNYLDGSSSNYVCSSETEEERLKDLMVEQALDRQGMMKIRDVELLEKMNVAAAFISAAGISIMANYEQYALSALLLGGTFATVGKARKLKCQLYELKKYKLFLEMSDDVARGNGEIPLEVVDHDKIYQVPLGINTVDRYSYGQVKTLYKEFYRNF